MCCLVRYRLNVITYVQGPHQPHEKMEPIGSSCYVLKLCCLHSPHTLPTVRSRHNAKRVMLLYSCIVLPRKLPMLLSTTSTQLIPLVLRTTLLLTTRVLRIVVELIHAVMVF